MPTCGACGEEVPPRFRFCGVCGAALPEQSTVQREIRKTVTVLFCDVVDSTRLGARLDPESLRHVMSRYFEVAREALQRHGGTVEKFIGDAVMGVFGVPTLHEDDALRAVRAATDLRQAVAGLTDELARDWGVELTVRIGVNTGPVIAGDPASGQTLVTGDAVNVAARLEQVAGPGEILIGPVTWSLVRDAVVAESVPGLALKGKDAPVEAYRVASVIPLVLGRARRVDTPMVGRQRERRVLDQAFERSAAESGCHLFTVLGPAGVGKSRLVHDFLADIGNSATVVRGRCLDYGEGITFWPVIEIAREAVGADQTATPTQLRDRLAEVLGAEEHGRLVADRVAALAGADDAASRAEEVSWAIRRLLEGLARERPLVVVLDDLHWAQPTMLDVVEHVADWSRDGAILLLCLARPELLDVRPGWAGGKMNATSILLEPLSPVESAMLVGNLLGEIADGQAVRDRIAAAAEGNPLFVEELVAMLVEDGLLVRRGDRWTATTDLEATTIPPTISALLAARLDRLARQERSVIERASVVGKTFYRTAVAELSPSELRPDVATNLMALVRKELIRPDRSGFLGDDAFRFRHLLIRDAAYEAMPRRERAQLHERLADWLEAAAAGKLAQFEEILGHHLEQAYRQRAELGVADERRAALAARATRHLAAAGRRALGLSDLPAALGLLQRALDLAPSDERATIAADLAEVLVHAGRLPDARSVLDQAHPAPGTPAAVAVALARVEVEVWMNAASLTDLAAELELVLAALDEGESRNRIRALNLLARVRWLQGHVTAARELTQQALAEARRSGDNPQVSYSLTELAFYTMIGPMPVPEAIEWCHQLLAEDGGDDQPMRASVLKTLSSLHAMRGEFDRARQLAGESTALFEQLGMRLSAAQASVEFALRELAAGDCLAAEAIARRGLATLESMGETGYQTHAAALLAEALCLQGLHHEAGRFAGYCEQTADANDAFSQSEWRIARARVLAAEGDPEQALDLARAAVDRLAGTELLFLQGNAYSALADVLHQADRRAEALTAAEAAVDRFDAKGATAMRDHMRTLAEKLADDLYSEV